MNLIEIAKADKEHRGTDPIRVLAGTALGAGIGRFAGGASAGTKVAGGMSKRQVKAYKRGKPLNFAQKRTIGRGATGGLLVGGAAGGALGATS